MRSFAIWTVFVWIVFIRNVVIGGDGGTSARVVHGFLALVSIALAVLSWRVISKVRESR